MDLIKPLKHWEPDPEVPTPDAYPWVAHRTDDMPADLSNVRCPGCEMIIASGLPNRVAMQIADAHNGMFTEHETDGTSLIHEV